MMGYEDAAREFRRALELLEGGVGTDERRIDALLGLGEALDRAGRADEARRNLRRAADLSTRLRDGERLARVALALGGSGFGGTWAVSRAHDELLVSLLEQALEWVGSDHEELRARVLARLATALHYSPDSARRESSSSEALAMIRGASDVEALTHVLGARHYALCGPEHAEERLAIADEMTRIARRSANPELDLVGRGWRCVDLVELGKMSQAAYEIESYVRTADRLRQPFHLWYGAVWRAMYATVTGRFDDAEWFAREAFALGRRAQEENAHHTYVVQSVALRWLQGGIEEAIRDCERAVSQYPEMSGWGISLALSHARAGNAEEARRERERALAAEDADLSHGASRLLLSSFLAEIAFLLNEPERALPLYESLHPYRSLCVVDGHDAVAWYGSVSYHLGLLAKTLDRLEAAVSHLEEALDRHERMGAHPFVARSALELGRILFTREQPSEEARGRTLLGRATTIAKELGMPSILDDARTLQPRDVVLVSTPDSLSEEKRLEGVFRVEGAWRSIVFGTDAFRVRDSVGLRYVALLLGHPGRAFHLTELLSLTGGSSTSRVSLKDAGEVLDAPAKAGYRRRLEELQEALDEAKAAGRTDRAEDLEREIDFLTRELSRAVGLRGRDRRAGSELERARVRVTKAIRAAIRKIEAASPSLGHHLRTTIRTGVFCSYEPDPSDPPRWRL